MSKGTLSFSKSLQICLTSLVLSAAGSSGTRDPQQRMSKRLCEAVAVSVNKNVPNEICNNLKICSQNYLVL